MSDNKGSNAQEITKIMGKKGPLFCRREWMKHILIARRPRPRRLIKIPMRRRLQRVRGKGPNVLPKRVDETHPNLPETETAITSDNKDSNMQEITKSKGKKAQCVAEEIG